MTDRLTRDRFVALSARVPYAPRGMFYSELFLFLTQCVEARVTLIVESGVRHGVSTRLIAASGIAPLIAIDLKHLEVGPVAGAELRCGDGRELVPTVLAQYPEGRIGVLLDGPKGPKGLALKDVCLTYPQVRVVGCHDTGPGHGETAHSHDPAWRAAYADLDVSIPVAVRAARPLGPGLGLWVV